MKPVVFTLHARQEMVERSATDAEVIGAIRDGPWHSARSGRYRTTKWYPFRQTNRGRFYAGKDVQPIFADESDQIVVVTVYVYLNQLEEP